MIRSGKIIAGERERFESDSERERVRKRAKTRKKWSVVCILAIIGVFCWLIWLGGCQVVRIINEEQEKIANNDNKYAPTVEIIDEDGRKNISNRVKEYVGQIEVDFRDLGYKVSQVVLPVGAAREIDVYLDSFDFYIKVNIDRGTAVSAEDADRMIKYLSEKSIEASYIDVRVEGKGYYK